MRPHVPAAILQFLESFHQEILEIETLHGAVMSSHDPRPPIAYYHDTIRALQSGDAGHERLTVERVSADLTRIRRHVEWLESGPFVFLSPNHAPGAQGFKRRLIAVAGEVASAPEAMLIDLADFLRRHQGRELQDALNRRGAEALTARRGAPHYGPYPAAEFWKDAQAIIRRWQETAAGVLPPATAGLLEGEAARPFRPFAKPAPRLSRTDPRQARQQLTALWLHTVHPLNLWQAAAGHDGANPARGFDAGRVISESRWQELSAIALNLARLYEQYIVLFAAAVQDTVNRNFKELLDAMNLFVTDAAELMELIQDIMAQAAEVELQQLQEIIEQTPNPELKESLLLLLHAQMMERNRRDAKKEAARAVIKEIEGLIRQKDAAIESLDKAHFDFLAGQLMVYHQSQDLIKKMSGQGLNIAGKFMETETARGTGRGQGPRRGR